MIRLSWRLGSSDSTKLESSSLDVKVLGDWIETTVLWVWRGDVLYDSCI